MTELVQSVLWRRLDQPGAETCELRRTSRGWELRGVVVLAFDGSPGQGRYRVACDRSWRTASVDVTVRWREDERRLHLVVEGEPPRWRRKDADGLAHEVEAVRGLVDVDLGVTPSTNTLPIRRVAPQIGEVVDVTAAWVAFPSLEIEPLRQRYTRLGDRHYRYESLDSGFSADLRVDDEGLVVGYSDIWELAAASGS